MDLDAAEAQLDAFIERRARQGEQDPDELEPGYAESVRRFHERRHQENRARWYAFHLDQAERIRQTMGVLVAEHEAQAAKLLEGPGEAS